MNTLARDPKSIVRVTVAVVVGIVLLFIAPTLMPSTPLMPYGGHRIQRVEVWAYNGTKPSVNAINVIAASQCPYIIKALGECRACPITSAKSVSRFDRYDIGVGKVSDTPEYASFYPGSQLLVLYDKQGEPTACYRTQASMLDALKKSVRPGVVSNGGGDWAASRARLALVKCHAPP